MAKHRARSRQRNPNLAQSQSRFKQCVVCQTAIDPPLLSMKTAKGPAHLLCAALDKMGLGALARTSGR